MFNTRIAPSPTGNFHLGTARTAYFSWLAARSSGGKFLLRIDDTDVARSKEKYVDVILKSMDWLGLDYDDYFKQTDRFSRYHEVLGVLVDNNIAYRDNINNTYRLCCNDIPDLFEDYVGGSIKISKQDKEIARDFIIFKSDDTPTYHFASVVDDIDYSINLVLRGKDHISNTARHIGISNALNKVGINSNITYGHIGLILKDGKKISKSDGTGNILNYKENYCPEAILNCLLKLGWSSKDPNIDKTLPLITKSKAIDLFGLGNLRASNCNFDQVRLNWLNKKYKQQYNV